MFIFNKKIFLYTILVTTLVSCSKNKSKSHDASLTSIAVIQYNVKQYISKDKRDTWGNETFRKEQVNAIQKVIQSEDSVDFIAFEMGDSPKLSNELKSNNFKNWDSLVNPSIQQKQRSENQITYNTDRWELIEEGSGSKESPLPHIKGFRSGYWMGELKDMKWDFSKISDNPDIVHRNIRIYSLGYFLYKGDKKTKVLFVASNFPHFQDFGAEKWNWNQFNIFARELIGKETKLSDVHIIFSGDMNMSKENFHQKITKYLQDFGSFHVSKDLKTCCYNGQLKFEHPFDHVTTNKGEIDKSYILPKTGTFNPNGEEHKAIYVEIKL